MQISRDKYLTDLVNRMHNDLIKVITGIRRCGKSYLIFHIFKEYLPSNNIDDAHIIEIALDQRKNSKYRNLDVVLEYIESLISDEQMYYVLLDEVQMLTDFEEVLNSLLHVNNVDVYVTGSNSKFLSKDVITEFRERGDEIHIYPLTFKEFMQVYDGDEYHGWADYVMYGGLPLIASMKTDEQKVNYLVRLFEETYLKDIIERNHVEKVQELGDLTNVIASGIGTLSNPSKIQATFKSSIQSDISLNTIRQYIEYLKDSFIINEANRYDVKGRKYIGTPLKYYFEDIVTLLHHDIVFDYARRMQQIQTDTRNSLAVTQCIDYIYEHLHDAVTLDSLAKHTRKNPTYLCALFKKEMNITIGDFIRKKRIESAENLLKYSDYPPVDISNYLCFNSHSHFISVFKKYTGMTPGEYRKRCYRSKWKS